MVLEVGEIYETRNGNIVKIERDERKDSSTYFHGTHNFFGNIKNSIGQHVRLAYFSPYGNYRQDFSESEFDIISEYNKPFDDKAYIKIGLNKYL